MLHVELLESRDTPAGSAYMVGPDLHVVGDWTDNLITLDMLDASIVTVEIDGDSFGPFSVGGGKTVINGGAGSDSVTVNDKATTGGPFTYTVTAVTLNRTGQSQTSYSAVESLTVNASAATNTINVTQVVAAMPVVINGGTGTDTLIGPNTANIWDVTDPASQSKIKSGVITDAVKFTNVENLTGGASTDTFNLDGNTAIATINGGAGSDKIDLSLQTSDVVFTINSTNNGTTSLTSAVTNFAAVESLTGGTGNDVFKFNANNVGVSGVLDGSTGTNWLDYSGYTTTGVVVTLGNLSALGSATNVGGGAKNITNVIGGGGNDVLTGNDSNNVIWGLGGNDRILGGAGKDVLIGGAGADTIDGGAGEDIVVGGNTGATTYADLQSVMPAWTAVDTVANRRTAIQALGFWAPTDDSAADRLSGGVGEADWFVNFVSDILTDYLLGADEKDS